MSQSSQLDTSGRLAKLPIDVLLSIFDDCDIVDIINLALVSNRNRIRDRRVENIGISSLFTAPQTCKELRTIMEERHAWLILPPS